MRPLTLHVSALSDAEYAFYTASLDDLASDRPARGHDDARHERTVVGVREARAWLRGRFADLPAADIDTILRLFHPSLLPSDTLTGGQFFAALRLVVHADSGRGLDRALAFIQGQSSAVVQFRSSTASLASPKPARALDPPPPLSPPKRSLQAPPPSHPDRQKPSPPVASSPETNPFARRSLEHATTPAPPPPPPPADLDPPPPPVCPQKRPGKISHNPFLARDKPEAAPAPAAVSKQAKLPPLPPRKPAVPAAPPRRASEAVLPTPPMVPAKPTHVMSPLMRQSLEASKHAQSLKRAEEQLDRERVLQVLKSTSVSTPVSSASSSSVSTTPSTRTRSLSPTKQPQKLSHGYAPDAESDDARWVPPLPRRRQPSLPLSSRSGSVLSLDQVANATLPSPIVAYASATGRPPLPSREQAISQEPHTNTRVALGSIPPPTHPTHRLPSTSATAMMDPAVNDTETPRPCTPSGSPPPPPPARLGRSNSLAASSTITGTNTTVGSNMPLPPPPRRKRPESVQLSSTQVSRSDAGDLAFARFPQTAARTHSRTTSYHGQGPGQGLSRHLSLSREKERGREHHHESADPSSSSPFSTVANVASVANIQRTLANLQPKLDAVRYKAEAGLSKRGYVHHAQLGSIIRRRLSWREEGEEGLMADTRWSTDRSRRGSADKHNPLAIDDPRAGYSNDSEPTTDTDEPFDSPVMDKDAPYREELTESDNLKWPMGQGWKPL